MKRKFWLLSVALLAVAGIEFGLLGAASAGASFVPAWLGASKNAPPALRDDRTACAAHNNRCTPTPAPTPVSPPPCRPDREHAGDVACAGQPASMQLTPDPLVIHCDGADHSTVTVRVTDAKGQPVADGTNVYFSAYNGSTTPQFAQTRRGVASTSVVFYGDIFNYGPNVTVDAGPLEAGVRIRCFPNSNPQPPSPPPCPMSPPSVSPPCATATPFPTYTPIPTPTPIIGGEISIGTPSLVGGQIVVPVLTSASPNAYAGANVHLKFDGTLLSFAAAQAGDALNPPQGGFCVSSIEFEAGSGVIVGCVPLGAFANSSAGTLMNIRLTPKTAAGCSTLHLLTYGPPDGGDSGSGTFTLDASTQLQERNTYGPDISIDVSNGATGCLPSATPTPVATATTPVG